MDSSISFAPAQAEQFFSQNEIFIYIGWKKGYCLDENGFHQKSGGIEPPSGDMTREECLNWCSQQSLATGCEYQISLKKCLAHTFSVSSANGALDKLCSVILPKGLFFIYVKTGTISVKRKVLVYLGVAPIYPTCNVF